MRLHDYSPRPAQLKWLLDSDPAIRRQVMRDLAGEAPNAIAAERSRIATEGWGAKLLALQFSAGNWGRPNEDRGSLITLYSVVVLMDLGLDPSSKQGRKIAIWTGYREVRTRSSAPQRGLVLADGVAFSGQIAAEQIVGNPDLERPSRRSLRRKRIHRPDI